MGRKRARYTVEEKLFYIGLVQDGIMTTNKIETQYGVRHS